MADFLMPALGADMETGKVVDWRVAEGSRVHPGDVVAVVETHKGAIDVECFLDGVIHDLVPLGAELPVGAALARVEEGATATAPASPAVAVNAPAARAAPPAVTAPETSAAAALAPGVPARPTGPSSPSSPSGPSGPTSPRSLKSPTEPPPSGSVLPADLARPGRARISPAARRRAAELGVDPATLQGTGVEGSIVRADVERWAAAPPASPAGAGGRFDAQAMRQAIAVAMSRSKREIPHYYLSTTVDFAAAEAWLASFNAERDPAQRLLPAALLLKATARGLAAVPQLNGYFEEGRFRPGTGVHVGWAVALRGGGLIAPAIRHADRLDLPTLMLRLRDLVQRARTGGLRSSELTDPSITVTSLGDRGAEAVWGVIVPPQVAILGFGRIAARPWVVDGQVMARPLVTLSLAADHRVSDGHLGGQLLAAIDGALRAPESL